MNNPAGQPDELGPFPAVIKQSKDGKLYVRFVEHHGLLKDLLSRQNHHDVEVQELVSGESG